MNPYGRPKLPPGDVKKVFPLRLSKNEQIDFERIAAAMGVPMREWMVKTLKRESEKASRTKRK